MTKREDGKETKRKLLDAACEVFAQKGFRDAKVAEICQEAGANVAAVNYYFRDKENLYRESWLHSLRHFMERDPTESNAGTPQQRLRDYIYNMIQNFTGEDKMQRFSRLYQMEMVNPTGLIQDTWREQLDSRRQRLHAIIRDIIGTQADELSLRLCELTIISQCRVFVTLKRNDLEYMLGQPLTPEVIQRIADHIAEFSLAGVMAAGGAGSNDRK
ncbi:MAG: CerR family C-terminal domain-containing protein [Desulfobacteraceae bacterium]|nr:CerR family C-terminal domain-containing protein [Desulfobacteraceae bacterium]